jgi:hypothetical protein
MHKYAINLISNPNPIYSYSIHMTRGRGQEWDWIGQIKLIVGLKIVSHQILIHEIDNYGKFQMSCSHHGGYKSQPCQDRCQSKGYVRKNNGKAGGQTGEDGNHEKRNKIQKDRSHMNADKKRQWPAKKRRRPI